ncbi:n-acetylglucosaminyldiphosphoundecaprenol N-acetyl-beta-D-mannosaminyltransferase [Brachyspira sp. CAG:484]|mgnify:FL=1|nr:n-acetylglucosaminyldiphosphoundecaprenol N-acetyl-beta-D-mannosaminyltransferase [Brachyspira sp. CAG:484]
MERNTVKLQGFSIDTFTFDDALEYAANNSGQIVTINPEMIQTASKNQIFADIINNAELVVPDGIGVEIGLKILGHKVRRIAGIELGRALIDRLAGEPVAFIGAKPEIIEKAVDNLKKEVSNLNPVYVQDGYFKDDERVLDELTRKHPRLVLVALGSPKQEFFINEAKKRLPDAVFIGLGGSFDVWSGVVQRAPEVYQKMGLEWLYRTVKEPQRFKRIFPTLPLFILKVVKEKFIGV